MVAVLAACPFCGETENLNLAMFNTKGAQLSFIRCGACGAQGPFFTRVLPKFHEGTDMGATNYWNNRKQNCGGKA